MHLQEFFSRQAKSVHTNALIAHCFGLQGCYSSTATFPYSELVSQLKSSEDIILNATQCKMARAATGLGLRELAVLAEVSPNTISRLERGEELKASTVETIRAALEVAGIEFIAENGGGPGVRIKK